MRLTAGEHRPANRMYIGTLSKGKMTRIYPSCLYNRISEARTHLPGVKKADWKSIMYPYKLIDLAVRMRPIVDVINSAKGIDPKVELLVFEPSWWFDGNKKYIGAQSVSIKVLLGAIIHESYLHIGPTQDSGDRQRLDVKSDRGRWIVHFDDFIDTMSTYLLSTDEIAESVCDMIDNHQRLLSNKPDIRWKAPPNIGNLDLDWLLWVYLSRNPKTKQAIVSSIFNIESIPADKVMELRFSANSVGHATFDLHFSPSDWSSEIEGRKRVEWGAFTRLVRSLLPSS